MNECDQQWNVKYEKLVEFKRKKGHCILPCACEQDKSLGIWVRTQRGKHSKMRPDRKERHDEIGFAWKEDRAYNDKLWHQQCEELVEFKRTNGHCLVPNKYEQDKSLGIWVKTQRTYYNNNKMRSDRKELLDEIAPTPSTKTAPCSGTSSMESWSILNQRVAIGWCHARMRRTFL
jgi:hypothetical protein